VGSNEFHRLLSIEISGYESIDTPVATPRPKRSMNNFMIGKQRQNWAVAVGSLTANAQQPTRGR
jgi:hypothetical protein